MPRKLFLNPPFVLALLQSTFLLALTIDLLSHETIREIFAEDHAIELMSVLLLVAAAGLLMMFDPGVRKNWHLPTILALIALRELDLDKRLTSEGVLQLRLYSGAAPLWEKAFGMAVVTLVLACTWRLLTRTIPHWWKGLREGQAVSWLGLGAVSAILIAKSLDGLGRKLAPLGVHLDQTTLTVSGRLEELLEMVAGMLLVMAVTYFGRSTAPGPRPTS